MRMIAAVVATAFLGACATPPAPQEVAVQVEQEKWILIAPPDNVATVAFIETFEFLPDHRDRFPGHTNGMSEDDRASLEALFDQVAAEADAEDRLEILTEVAAETEAPVKDWREVRTFRSALSCNSTREELLKVTGDQTKKFGAYSDMPREEYQWPLLEKSFQFSRCVPEGMAPSVL